MDTIKKKRLTICMASDFFFPNTGGVESHVYQLSQCLMSLGHKVIMITHSYDDRSGIRYMTRGFKVYYLPVLVIYNQCTLPTLFATFPLVRYILIREGVDIVHGHSAFSALAHEVMMHAKTIGIKTVFTDHSLFGFADASAIITNKLLQMSLSICDHVICVSHTGKENTALRAGVDPHRISVIPNAVDTAIFTPDPRMRDASKITIVVISRLVYRKGVDLLAGVIPAICSTHPEVCFIIGGDGPKRIVLEEVIETYGLQERVSLLGSVNHERVRDILVTGDIFLNSSLTEAFCMAIVEAASCGLQVVSTNVGGIPEVLPLDLIWLSDPSVDGLIQSVEKAIADKLRGNVIDPFDAHARIKSYYQWDDIAKRTLKVYNAVTMGAKDGDRPIITEKYGDCSTISKDEDLKIRLRKLYSCGPIFGAVFVIIGLIEHLLSLIYEWYIPKDSIDRVVDMKFPSDAHAQDESSKIVTRSRSRGEGIVSLERKVNS